MSFGIPAWRFLQGRCFGGVTTARAATSVMGLGVIRSFGVKARNRGTVYVPIRTAKKTLLKSTRNTLGPTLLLPPYVSASELRILFRMDYSGIFRLLGVRKSESKWFWKDHDGREFETSSKRKVLVPFDLATIPAHGLGLKPVMVDVEPDWSGRLVQENSTKPTPVVAVLGHINHGKTTLLDALCGTGLVKTEPGNITQSVHAVTADVSAHLGSLQGSSADGSKTADWPLRITFLDTPGHEAFELQRGRTMAAADVAVIIVSTQQGVELQTQEVLLHASQWKVPVVFALNKIDLPESHIELTKAELRRECQRLYEQGLVTVDWTAQVENAVPISALHSVHLGDLLSQVGRAFQDLPLLPLRELTPPTTTPGEASRYKNVQRRTDFLVGVESLPSAVALVIEISRSGDQGQTLLTLLVRTGRLVVGQYFVVGTAFGRISRLSMAIEGEAMGTGECESATAGTAVMLAGLRTKSLGGDCAPDDFLFVLPRERAWRLSEHRRRIEELSSLQTAGPDIEVSWEHSSNDFASRTQAAFDRGATLQPEKHAASAYQRRLALPAISEFSEQEGCSPTFSLASRREFTQALHSPLSAAIPDMVKRRDDVTFEPMKAGGRKHARQNKASSAVSQECNRSQDNQTFAVLTPSEQMEEDPSPQHKESIHDNGRRSARGMPTATGAWTTSAKAQGDFVYYTDRQTWTEEADIDNSRLRARWQWRDEARWEEEQRQQGLKDMEKKFAEEARAEIFGKARSSRSGGGAGATSEDSQNVALENSSSVVPLPPKNSVIVPLILKTRTVSQFDVIMDELERVEVEYNVRVVIVHGGIGPVIPRDVVHAEVEKHYGFCPIYAFQVGVNPMAIGQANAQKIDIRRLDVFTDLVADVSERCERIDSKSRLQSYAAALKEGPTASGL